jgi:hypothetical protein
MNTQINEGINLSEGHLIYLYENLFFCSLILEHQNVHYREEAQVSFSMFQKSPTFDIFLIKVSKNKFGDYVCILATGTLRSTFS